MRSKEDQKRYYQNWKNKHRNPENIQHHRRVKKNSDLKRRYGISLLEFEQLINKQKGKCAICDSFHGDKLVTDHNHDTKNIRELLCNSCNRALGYFKDNIKNLQSAIKYLRKHT